MTTTTQDKLDKWDIRPMARLSIGFDEIFNEILRSANAQPEVGYPPYNIIKYSDDKYAIELAIAGFTQDEIVLSTENNRLIVSGERKAIESVEATYVHRGISSRSFIRTFTLGSHIVIDGATTKNGMLTVSLSRVLPDYLKPRRIDITDSN
jgi:molecular chaperone IbpA